MQEFFIDSQKSKYIKYLLSINKLPVYSPVVKDDYIINKQIYFYKNNLIKCTKSGKLSDNYNIIDDLNMIDENHMYENTYDSIYSYYDSYTHERLGEYLRYYRSSTGIDLMPFYNCFSNRYCDDIRFIKNSSLYTHKLNSKKVLMIPIKFDKYYTIAINSMSPVMLKALFYNDGLITYDKNHLNLNNLLNNAKCSMSLDGFTVEHLDTFDDNGYANIKSSEPAYISHTYYNKPFVFKISLNNDTMSDAIKRTLKSYEKYLYLFIQLNSSIETSISVLEGNYLKSINNDVYNFEHKFMYIDGQEHDVLNELKLNILDKNSYKYYNFLNSNITNSIDGYHLKQNFALDVLDNLSYDKINSYILSDLSLLRMDNGKSYAFSDRLFEYLVGNVITSEDTLSRNIITVNNSLKQLNGEINSYEWSLSTRYDLYNALKNLNVNNLLDINGYGDKDSESLYIKDGEIDVSI